MMFRKSTHGSIENRLKQAINNTHIYIYINFHAYMMNDRVMVKASLRKRKNEYKYLKSSAGLGGID